MVRGEGPSFRNWWLQAVATLTLSSSVAAGDPCNQQERLSHSFGNQAVGHLRLMPSFRCRSLQTGRTWIQRIPNVGLNCHLIRSGKFCPTSLPSDFSSYMSYFQLLISICCQLSASFISLPVTVGRLHRKSKSPRKIHTPV